MWLERMCYAVLALIHLSPASLLLRPQALAALYGVKAKGPLLTLLHHRAALFVIATSMVSFLFVYWHAGSPPELKRIAVADLVGLPFLAFAAWQTFAAWQAFAR